jgi:hypothetical protein
MRHSGHRPHSLKAWLRPLVLLLLMGGTVPAPPMSAALLSPGLYMLRADTTRLEMVWVAPPVQTHQTENGTLEIEATGCLQTQNPGAPRLPFTSTLIALPPAVSPTLHVLFTEETRETLLEPLAIAPRPDGVARDGSDHPVGGTFADAALIPDTQLAASVTLEQIGIVRGVHLARLTFYPAIPEETTLHVTHRLHLEITWEPQARLPQSPLNPLASLVQQQVINPWDIVQSPTTSRQLARDLANSLPTAYIEVETSGLYTVTYDDLNDLGFAGADPQNLRLFQGSDEVAYEWLGDTDAAFEPGESLRFYAKARFSRWTGVDALKLVADVAPGQRMASRSADPAGQPPGVAWVEQSEEENQIYTPDCFCGSLPPGRDGDRWTWRQLRLPDLPSTSFSVQTTAIDTGQQAELTLWLVSYTDVAANPDHRVEVALNSTPLGRVEWDGKTAITATLPITAGVLHDGTNTLTLTLPGISGVSVEETWIDAFAIRYARSQTQAGTSIRFASDTTTRQAYTVTLASPGPYLAYDITDPLEPQILDDVQTSGNTITVGDPPGGGPRRYLVVAETGDLAPAQVRAPRDP